MRSSLSSTVLLRTLSRSKGAFEPRLATQRRYNASSASTNFVAQVAERKYQIYTSKSTDPCVNLSIEHYLLQKSHKDSYVLFLYVNRPSIVIGRNQNPWLEVDLKRIRRPTDLQSWSANGNKIPAAVSQINLVRRRSGGGTVFHDEGNINYCVISPNSTFTRDKHAEMAVRAIRDGMNPRVRVNERHDIVLDVGTETRTVFDPENMHETPFTDSTQTPLKVSGSAYKMIKNRSLHHGTCLINSPNLRQISSYLKSPAASHIVAQGVDSVRTPVANIFSNWQPNAKQMFQTNMVKFFCKLYNFKLDKLKHKQGDELYLLMKEMDLALTELDENVVAVPEIEKGIRELRSDAWTYGQTPRFTFSTRANHGEKSLPWHPPIRQPEVRIMARQGKIEEATIDGQVQETLVGSMIHEINDFGSRIRPISETHGSDDLRRLGDWLNDAFAVKR